MEHAAVGFPQRHSGVQLSKTLTQQEAHHYVKKELFNTVLPQ